MRRKLPEVGDVLEIQLPDGRYAYAHYAFADGAGALLRVVEGIFDHPLSLDQVDVSRHRFWCYAGINPPVRQGRWKVIGRRPVAAQGPPFLRTRFSTDALRSGIWFVRRVGDPPPGRRVGAEPPSEFWDLDWEGVLAAPDLEVRILTGKIQTWRERADAALRGEPDPEGPTPPATDEAEENWEAHLFDDDLAIDIKLAFEAALEAGSAPAEAAEQVLRENRDILGDADDEPVLWISLASLLLDSGVRQHTVFQRAHEALQSRAGLDRWREQGDAALHARLQVYRQLAERLESAQLDPE